jgi:hypothetical protein
VADIDIQKKETAIWPWIVGLLVLALLIWAALSLFGGDDADRTAVTDPAPATTAPGTTAPAPGAAMGAAGAPAAVPAYMDTCATRQPGEMDLDHAHTSSCIRHLADGLEAVVQQRNLTGVNVQPQLQQARQNADRLAQSPPGATDHTAMTRDAFDALAQAMGTVQNAHYPQLQGQVSQVQSAAGNVQRQGILLDQRENVQRFFEQAGQALNQMATTGPGTA